MAMTIRQHGVHKNWYILHATKNNNFLRMENETLMYFPMYSRLSQEKHSSLGKHFDDKVGMSLILFHDVGK